MWPAPILLAIHNPHRWAIQPLSSSFISLAFLIAGGVAIFSMLFLQGGNKVAKPKQLIRIHKIAGWIFASLFLIMFAAMLWRIEDYWEESSPRIAMHVSLATGLLLLIIIKVVIPRWFPRLRQNLFVLGITIYVIAFTLVGITAGYYAARLYEKVPYISHARLSEHMNDERIGKELFITKCSTCHTLDKIMNPRSVGSWEKVVNDMVKIADPRITPDEASQILYYLSISHVPKPVSSAAGANPVEMHCLPCHQPQDILGNMYNRNGWEEVVKQMHEYDPQIVPNDKINEIVDYLLGSQGGD